MYFRSTFCNVPGQFRAACIPAIIGDNVFAQDKGSFDPANGPAVQQGRLRAGDAFNYYYGRGNRVEETIRGFAYQNQDLTVMKNIRMAGGTNLEFRFEAFNMWNWHTFSSGGAFGDQAFNTDIASPNFGSGMAMSRKPRILQLGIRFEF